jgi:outer membrane protein OmpA-like peptidoglycan-associated protein
MAVLVFFFVRALRRFGSEVARLRRQTEEMNRRLTEVKRQSQAAAQQAVQAAQSAEVAARQRDQAEAARAQSQNQARQAQQQAASAEQEAKLAEQKAEQYRQQREQELARLQQVLGQIAETRRTAMGLVVTLGSNSIRFDFDKADIKLQYREILSRIAGVLMSVRGYSIYVYGYTDDIGTQEYNLKLSERRAQAVRDYLVQAGLDPKIITTKGYGKSDPRVPGDSAEARAMNRRVEIGLVDSTLHFEGSSY